MYIDYYTAIMLMSSSIEIDVFENSKWLINNIAADTDACVFGFLSTFNNIIHPGGVWALNYNNLLYRESSLYSKMGIKPIIEVEKNKLN